jgi:hypothetical protein
MNPSCSLYSPYHLRSLRDQEKNRFPLRKGTQPFIFMTQRLRS